MGSWWGGRGGEPRPNTMCLDLHSNLAAWCSSPDPDPPGNWPRKICFETASYRHRPSTLYSQILPASRKVHASTLPRRLEAACQPGPWPGASPFIPPSTVTARFSVALFTRNHREGNRYGIPHAGSSGLNAGERPRSRENRCVGGQMGPGSTPWHKTRPPAGRGAVCTEPHQCTRASRDL